MALVKKILKSTPLETVIKWTGSGTDTQTLATLLATGQTVSGTPAAVIVDVLASISGAGTCQVTRNAVNAFDVSGNFSYQGGNGGTMPAVDENPTSDIAVTLGTVGTLVLRVKKTQGYTGVV